MHLHDCVNVFLYCFFFLLNCITKNMLILILHSVQIPLNVKGTLLVLSYIAFVFYEAHWLPTG